MIVLLAGTNSVGSRVPQEGVTVAAANITQRLESVVRLMRSKVPDAVIILMGIFPLNENMAVMPEIDKINANLSRMSDGSKIRYLSIIGKLADQDGKLHNGMMNERDKLHPQLKRYQVWAGR